MHVLTEQTGGDVLDLLAKSFGGNGVALELGELAAQDQQVEPFGVLVVVLGAGRKSGQILGDLIGGLDGQCRPRRPLRILLDQLAVRTDQEVVEVHPGDGGVQLPGGVDTQPALGFHARPPAVLRSPVLSWESSAVISPRRVSNSR